MSVVTEIPNVPTSVGGGQLHVPPFVGKLVSKVLTHIIETEGYNSDSGYEGSQSGSTTPLSEGSLSREQVGKDRDSVLERRFSQIFHSDVAPSSRRRSFAACIPPTTSDSTAEARLRSNSCPGILDGTSESILLQIHQIRVIHSALTAEVSTAQLIAPPTAIERELIVSRRNDWDMTPLAKCQQLPLPPLGQPVFDNTTRTDIDATSEAVAQAQQTSIAQEEKPVQIDNKPAARPWVGLRAWNEIRQVYAPKEEPELILPTAPTDQEKLYYLKTNRALLYSAGLFSFFSLCVGMWLFVISSVYYSWFGVFAGALQLYMGISYWVGLVGKDWDYAGHQKILEDTPLTAENSPTVDIYLPCAKEPIEVLRNTYEHVKKLDWPANKIKVYVLDDGAMPEVEALARSYGYEYIVRDDRPRLKKAGNLRWAFSRTSGDFFNIYDADFCPRPDFLKETIPRMVADPDIAIVQTPQFFRTKTEQTWVEQGAGGVQELFYRVVQVNRDRWGASICVGSNAVYRRSALEAVGGTAEIGFSEDVHTGFYAVDRGWKVRYIPLNLACGVCPDGPRAFFSQQMRWCMGSTTLLSNPDFWKSKLTPIQKVCYLCGMMYYSACAISIFVSPLPGVILVWTRPEYFKYYNLAFALPSLVFTIIAMRFWAKASYGFNVQHIMVIQNYAYLTAIKDRILGRGLMWAPSGDGKAHKSNKYRNMRVLAWCWMLSWGGALISGMVYQILRGLAWYNCIPLLLLDGFNIYIANRFLLARG